ncbi:CRISPR-associated protein Cas4 [Thermodesulfobacteriota bacterium B35]
MNPLTGRKRKMYREDDLLMLSALQHFLFCPRQCALIHVEQLWVENRLTAEGRILHERVHTAAKESRRTVRVEFDLPIRSLELGVVGRADVVEFHRQPDDSWLPFPVEYKRGRPKKDDSDRVQLCAQALCLEEMLSVDIPAGALYYGKKKRRTGVVFDDDLRQTTREAAHNLHVLLDSGQTPVPEYSRRCERCSLVELCLPRAVGKGRRVASYMDRMMAQD